MLWRGEKKGKLSNRRPNKTKKTTKEARDRIHRLSKENIELINARIKEASKMFPIEFQRKGKPLGDLENWKAVEFRNFLLYSGPVVLKDILEEKKYGHFLIFHAVIRILCSPSLKQKQIDFADKWLRYFVDQFGVIYGDHHLVYNVHSLMHLANDCRFQGPLDAFSAFPFESFLGQLKRLLRGTRRPLAQLKRRLSEIESIETNNTSSIKKMCGLYQFSLDTLKANSRSDSFVMYKQCQILYITSMSQLNVTGTPYSILDHNGNRNFYCEPIFSSRLHIHMSEVDSNEENISITIPLSNLRDLVKCVRITSDENYVFFPLLHNM